MIDTKYKGVHTMHTRCWEMDLYDGFPPKNVGISLLVKFCEHFGLLD